MMGPAYAPSDSTTAAAYQYSPDIGDREMGAEADSGCEMDSEMDSGSDSYSDTSDDETPPEWHKKVPGFAWKMLAGVDYVGGALADFFGITAPKYDWVIDEYERLKAEE